MLQFHPDKNPDPRANEFFLLIQQAYTVLSDEPRRKKYDAMLRYGFKSTQVNTPNDEAAPTKFDEDKGRKYGTKHKYPDEKFPPKKRYSKKDMQQFKKMENFMFYSLVLLGVLSIFLAASDLINNKWEGFDSLNGMIFGLAFTVLLIYIWQQFYREPNKK